MGMGRGRAPCCEKVGLNKGSWTPEEDVRLMAYIRKHGHANWRALPKQAGLLRCGKSCRLRWINYLRPDIKRGNLSKEEEDTIVRLHGALGNKWSKIASCLPGRTDNEIKNVWNTHLKKRLAAATSTSSPPAKDKKDRKPPATAHDKSEEELPSSPASSVVTNSSMSCSEQGESEHTHANTNQEAANNAMMMAQGQDEGIDKVDIPIEPNLDLCSSSSTMQGRPRDKSDKTSDLANSPLLRTISRSNVTWQEVGVAGDLPGSAYNKDQGTTKLSSGSSNPTLRTGPAGIVILKDPLEEMPDISIEPEIWSMIEDEDEPSGGLGGGAESESERWLAYLEKELELWGDANNQEFGGEVEGGDPVTSYFQKSLSSSSSTPLDDLLYY